MIAETRGDTPGVPLVRLAAGVLWVAAWPALMFLVAGDTEWLQGWLFALWLIGVYVTITAWMYVTHPALLAERHRIDSVLALLGYLPFLMGSA